MTEMEKARKELNEIDAALAALFEKRMHAVEKIGAYKKEHGLPVLDAAREKENLARAEALLADPALKEYFLRWYQMTMDIAKEYQQDHIR